MRGNAAGKRLIVCPACKARLELPSTSTAPRIHCPKCDVTFPTAAARKAPPPWRFLVFMVVATVALFGGCAALISTASHNRSSDVTIGRPTPPLLSADELAEAEFSAALIQRGVQFHGDAQRDRLIRHGRTVCERLTEPGATMISASAELMDNYGYTGHDAGVIGWAAVQAFCPQHTR